MAWSEKERVAAKAMFESDPAFKDAQGAQKWTWDNIPSTTSILADIGLQRPALPSTLPPQRRRTQRRSWSRSMRSQLVVTPKASSKAC